MHTSSPSLDVSTYDAGESRTPAPWESSPPAHSPKRGLAFGVVATLVLGLSVGAAVLLTHRADGLATQPRPAVAAAAIAPSPVTPEPEAAKPTAATATASASATASAPATAAAPPKPRPHYVPRGPDRDPFDDRE
jgi:hypothetical protein